MIHALTPMSAPTIAPTHREEPDETRPRFRLSREISHFSEVEPKENERAGGEAQLWEARERSAGDWEGKRKDEGDERVRVVTTTVDTGIGNGSPVLGCCRGGCLFRAGVNFQLRHVRESETTYNNDTRSRINDGGKRSQRRDLGRPDVGARGEKPVRLGRDRVEKYVRKIPQLQSCLLHEGLRVRYREMGTVK
jgi:hypothetical protein